MNEGIKTLLTVLQLLLAFGNLCIMLWALKNFLRKPHDTLEEQVHALRDEVDEIKSRLVQGDKRFFSIDKSTEVLITCMLALVDFEISYCIHTGYEQCEDLTKCKEKLHEYLAKN